MLVQGYATRIPRRHGHPCPNQAEVTRLARAVLLEIHDEWAIAERRYLAEGSMALLDGSPMMSGTKEVERAKTVRLAS